MTHEVISAADNQRRVVVRRNPSGWEVSEEVADRVVRRVNYRDWHRVERALEIFRLDQSRAAHSTNL